MGFGKPSFAFSYRLLRQLLSPTSDHLCSTRSYRTHDQWSRNLLSRNLSVDSPVTSELRAQKLTSTPDSSHFFRYSSFSIKVRVLPPKLYVYFDQSSQMTLIHVLSIRPLNAHMEAAGLSTQDPQTALVYNISVSTSASTLLWYGPQNLKPYSLTDESWVQLPDRDL